MQQVWILVLLGNLLWCGSANLSNQDSEYVILNEQVISRYYVYQAKRLRDDKNVILLSVINVNCNSSRKIKVGSSYTFNVKLITRIEIDEGVILTLSRRQTIDGVEISDGTNFPFLINNSCNGFW